MLDVADDMQKDEVELHISIQNGYEIEIFYRAAVVRRQYSLVVSGERCCGDERRGD